MAPTSVARVLPEAEEPGAEEARAEDPLQWRRSIPAHALALLLVHLLLRVPLLHRFLLLLAAVACESGMTNSTLAAVACEWGMWALKNRPSIDPSLSYFKLPLDVLPWPNQPV